LLLLKNTVFEEKLIYASFPFGRTLRHFLIENMAIFVQQTHPTMSYFYFHPNSIHSQARYVIEHKNLDLIFSEERSFKTFSFLKIISFTN